MSFQNTNNVYASGPVSNVGGNQFNIHNATPATSDLHVLLAPVDDASYTRSGPVAACLKGTREDIIGKIVQCMKDDDRPICWLNGPAGSGKSAISQTIAERYAAKDRLLGSFFFSRGRGDRMTIARVIPTLAYQLSISIPATKRLIRDVLRDEPAIVRLGLKHQFKKLVVEPILAARNTLLARLARTKPVVIVIDAVDECDDKHLMAEFIEVVVGAFQENRQLPFRVVVTSRVEEHIREKLEAPAARLVMHHLSLQDFDARPDIHKFLRSSFSSLYNKKARIMRSVSLPFPSESDLDALAEKSDGLFIFAVTLTNYVCNENGLPQDNLQQALIADAGLDSLYIQVLSGAAHDLNFKCVIGTIVHLRSSLSITFLGHLLSLRAEEIVQALLGTQSILMIPEDDHQPIQLFHTSLRDFLMVKSRSGEFFIDPPNHHLFIVTKCLAIMTLRPQGGKLYNGGEKYACLNWCHHLHQGLADGSLDSLFRASLMSCMERFVSSGHHLWVNTLIHEGWKNVLDDLKSLLSMLKQLPDCPMELVWVLEDIETNTKLDIENFLQFIFISESSEDYNYGLSDASYPSEVINKWRAWYY